MMMQQLTDFLLSLVEFTETKPIESEFNRKI